MTSMTLSGAGLNSFRRFKSATKVPSHNARRDILQFAQQERYQKPENKTTFRALDCLNAIESYGFDQFDVFLGNDGEILISASKKEICLEVTVENDDTYTISLEIGDDRVGYDERVAFDRVPFWLKEALKRQWILSVGFGPITGTKQSRDGLVLRSEMRHPIKAAGRASLNIPVPFRRVAA